MTSNVSIRVMHVCLWMTGVVSHVTACDTSHVKVSVISALLANWHIPGHMC